MAGSEHDYLVGKVRVIMAREERLFCVTTRAPIEKLDEELDRLMPLLEAAQAEAGLRGAGPTVVRYFMTEEGGIWRMDVGVPVTSWDWVQPAGQAQIVTIPAIHCGALLHWGSLAHIGTAYEMLRQGIADAGFRHAGEGREWYLHFTGDTSDDNVILLQLEVQVA